MEDLGFDLYFVFVEWPIVLNMAQHPPKTYSIYWEENYETLLAFLKETEMDGSGDLSVIDIRTLKLNVHGIKGSPNTKKKFWKEVHMVVMRNRERIRRGKDRSGKVYMWYEARERIFLLHPPIHMPPGL